MPLNIKPRYQFGHDQKVKSRKLIQKLFSEGKQINAYPLMAIWLPENEFRFFQGGVSVSSRHFKKATDRNRIKRLMREAIRLQKNNLEQTLLNNNKKISLFLIYIGKELPEYSLIEESCETILKKLIKIANANS